MNDEIAAGLLEGVEEREERLTVVAVRCGRGDAERAVGDPARLLNFTLVLLRRQAPRSFLAHLEESARSLAHNTPSLYVPRGVGRSGCFEERIKERGASRRDRLCRRRLAPALMAWGISKGAR